MPACVAVINAGSSSVKFALYAHGADEAASFRGQVERIGTAPRMVVKDQSGQKVVEAEWSSTGFAHQQATRAIFETAMDLLGGTKVDAIGHRVVHGGTDFAAPVRLDDVVRAALRKLCPLAPLHQPHNLAAIDAIAEQAPHIPQVACFDTAFHRTQPALAQMFALPREITKLGVRRYGFHGLSYEYVSQRLYEAAPALADAKVIIAHLGNGASLCAVHAGRSVATTMGFTAVDGLMMGTRCGSLDPGVILYLMDERGMDARAIEELIYKRSGLLGVSGMSSDMRELQQSEAHDAKEAVSLFVYRIVREIGSLAASLGGFDALVFTGGIGQNDSKARSAICSPLSWLGVELDHVRNHAGKGMISSPDSAVGVWVITTDEEAMIARHTSRVLDLH